MPDTQGFETLRVVVVGGASGMGAAVARRAVGLGAHVTVLDVAKVDLPSVRSLRIDLRDRGSVDAALDEIGPVDVVFSCAGVADGTPGLMLVNFIAQRHLLERLLSTGQLGPGGSIVMISSVAGLPWLQNLSQVLEFLECPGWDEMAAWVAEHPDTDTYGFSKQAINAYISHRSFPFRRDHGVRINAVLPGPTDTPLARANEDLWLSFGADFRDACRVEPLSPEQIADVMIFLGAPASRGVNGALLVVDHGHVAAGTAGSFPDPIIRALAGLH